MSDKPRSTGRASRRANLFDIDAKTKEETEARGLVPEQKPAEPLPEPTEPETGLSAFSVRLPKAQKDALERWLWDKKGEKLAAGVRRMLTELMLRDGIRW